MALISLTTLVFEKNSDICFFSSRNSLCGIVSQVNTYPEVISMKRTAADKKLNTPIINATSANRSYGVFSQFS